MSLQFFIADDGVSGQELYVTNGTPAGTFRLKDINPGAGGSNVGNLVQSNGIMYFTAYDGSAYHLWRSDGTTAGTYALTTPTNGDGASNLINVNGTLYFIANDNTHGYGLYKSDGTVGGTSFVKAVSSPSAFTAVGNTLFFQAYDSTNGYELWKSDGTAAGTGIVKDIYPGSTSASLGNFAVAGGRLFFTADNGTNGNEVWVSDGSAAGTYQVKDLNPGPSGSSAGNFFSDGTHLFFTANDGAHATQLYATDGMAGNVAALTVGGNPITSYTLSSFTRFNNKFYFVAADPSGGRAIYTSDGTTTTKLQHLSSFGTFYNLGDKLLFNGNDGTHGSGFYAFDGTTATFATAVPAGFQQPVVSNGKLFFVAYDSTNGYELWVSDGTAAGTHITADVNPGPYDGNIGNISAVGTGVVFTASRPDITSGYGTELFFSDGTAAGTILARDINQTADHYPSLNSYGPFVGASGLNFFSASDNIHGQELWASDGTVAGSHMVADKVVGASGFNPQSFFSAGGKIYFTADDGVNGRQLYTSDGTTITQLTSGNYTGNPYNDTTRWTTINGVFYFEAYDNTSPNGWAWWTSDGTPGGTHKVVNGRNDGGLLAFGTGVIYYGNDGVNGNGLYKFDGSAATFVKAVGNYESATVSGNKLYYHSYDGDAGRELWVSDGTSGGTMRISDIVPGAYDSSPRNITGFGDGRAVFTAYEPGTGTELYISDGTAAGTMLLKDVNPTGDRSPSLSSYGPFVGASGLNFFSASDNIHGQELWVSDGTVAGSHMVADTVPGANGLNPQSFFSSGGKIYFTGDDGVHGRQLYTSNGTTITRLTSGDYTGNPYNDTTRWTTINGVFYFEAYDNTSPNGWAWWTTDGTTGGTHKVVNGRNDGGLFAFGTGIIYYGNDGVNGNGLYKFDGSAVSFVKAVGNYESATVSGNKLYYHSYDGGAGRELWVSDGTGGGTTRISDIVPGEYDSSPRNITGFGDGRVVFTAYEPGTGTELYVSNGTAAGTILLKDVNPTDNHTASLGINSGYTGASGLNYFAANDGIHGNELWVSDGTVAGSHMVLDKVSGANGFNPQNFFSSGGKIYFTGDDGVHGRQLYTANGSTITQLTSGDYTGNPYNDAGRWFTLNGQFFFQAFDGTSPGNLAIWTSDGTLAGTHKAANGNYDSFIAVGGGILLHGNNGVDGTGLYTFNGSAVTFVVAQTRYENPIVSGSSVFFTSYTDALGYELWVTNGTAAGTHLIQDLNPGNPGSYPQQVTSLGNGSVVFSANDGVHGRELFVTDGTTITSLGDLFPDAQGSDPDWVTRVGNKVFFTANYFSTVDGAHGRELFVTDGTAAGTMMVKDIVPGSGDSSPDRLFAFNGKLYFRAYDTTNGYKLWTSDGTTAGTVMIASGDGGDTYNPGNFLAADATHFYFTANGGLFYSDGTTAGTHFVSGTYGFDANKYAVINGTLFFQLTDGPNGYELYKTDGTVAGTMRVTDTALPNSSDAGQFTFVGSKIFFTANNGTNGNELWVTDGTAGGTMMVKDINPGAPDSGPDRLFALNGKLYFRAYDSTNGYKLWTSDGTAAGTVMVASSDGGDTYNPGNFLKADATHFYFTANGGLFYSDGTTTGTHFVSSTYGFDANKYSVINGTLFYQLYDDTNRYELWKTDGTAAGTMRLTDTISPVGSDAGQFTFVGSKIFFTANNGTNGYELWVTDGTAGGTMMVKDINPGAADSGPDRLFALNGKLYFRAYDSTNGYKLWVSDGTSAGTVMIASSDGADTYNPGNFLKADATHFYFTANGGLFYSDGTTAGTHYVATTDGFDVSKYSVINGTLFFQIRDNTNGYELWKTDGTVAGTVRLTDTNTPNTSNPGTFAAVDNVPPTVTGTGASALGDNMTNHPFAATVIGDADTPVQTMTVTIALDDPAKGAFTAASLAATGVVAGGVAGSYTYTGTPAQATAALQALVFQPTANRLVVGNSETTHITVAVNDGHGGSVTNTDTAVTATSINDAPVGAADTGAVNEDATITRTSATGVLVNDTDADVGETATLIVKGAHFGAAADTAVTGGGTVIHGTYGDLTIKPDGSYSYTPNTTAAEMLAQGQSATEAFSYTVADVHGATGTATLTFTITGQEDAPIAVADVRAINEDATSAGANRAAGLLANDTDIDNGEQATLKITAAHFGTNADTAVASTSTTPIAGTYGTLNVAADGSYSYTPNTAAAEALTQGQAASDVFTYTMVDAQGQSSTTTVTFNVTGQNDAPVGVSNYGAVNEDATIARTTRANGVLNNDTDVDTGEAATLVVTGAHFGTAADTPVTSTTAGTVHGTYGDLTIAANGTYSYTPNSTAAEALAQGQIATETFSYTLADVQGATATATLVLTITGQEDAPVAVADVRAVNEDATSSTAGGAVDLLANDTDVDSGEQATLAITGAHAGAAAGANTAVASSGMTSIAGAYGTLMIVANGGYSYTPNNTAAQALPQGQTATDAFSYTITDAQGQTSTSTVTFNVIGQNDGPVATGETVALNEDSTASTTTRAAGLLGNDTDADTGEAATLVVKAAHSGSAADTAVLAAGTTDIAGTYGTLHLAANGTYSYTPNSTAAEALTVGQPAIETFTYTVADAQGATTTATLTFNITGQEDAPAPTADVIAVNEDATASAATRTAGLLGNDTDPDSGETATLVLSGVHSNGSGADVAVGAANTNVIGGYGTLVVSPDGTYSYSPNNLAAQALAAGATATDSFVYSVTDAQGVRSSSTVTFNITGVDDPAVALNDSNAVRADQTITGAGVLGNDYDVDGPALSVGAANGSSASVGQQITLTSGALVTMRANGTYDYNPNHAFDNLSGVSGASNSTATDSFTYTLANGGAATVTVTVSGSPTSTTAALGTSGNDTMTGTGNADLFMLNQGGSDTASGGSGNDGFYMGAAWDSGDRLDGGAGTLDQVGVQGNYAGLTLGASGLTGVEMLVFLPGSDTRFGDTSGASYSYNITTNDGNVAAGQQLIVQANTLRAGENITFNGAAETDGTFLFYGGNGNDHFTGGQGVDAFYFGVGRFGSGDTVDGQGGADQMGLQGDYSGANAITFGAGQITSIDTIALLSGADTRFNGGGSLFSYTLTINDANAAAGSTMTVNANALRSGEVLTLNAAAEHDASYRVMGGAGNDVITGGDLGDTIYGNAGNDTITGRGGADQLYGGAGNDTFVYQSVSDSTAAARDHIFDFTGGDILDVAGAGMRSFSTTGFHHVAGEVIATYGGGTWLIEGDADGNGIADLSIQVDQASTYVWSAADFHFASPPAAAIELPGDQMAKADTGQLAIEIAPMPTDGVAMGLYTSVTGGAVHHAFDHL